MTTRARALGPVRHLCIGNGGCCHGTLVRPMSSERAAIQQRATEIGVKEPFDGQHLRMSQGQCVFLDPARRCRLPAAFGPEGKPALCRQYPRILVRTASEMRVGVDPGCYSAHASWRHGPQGAIPTDMLGADSELPPEQQRQERALLGVTGPGATVAGVVRAMCPPVPEGPGLPPSFASRWVEMLQQAPLARVLDLPECGTAMQTALRPVLQAAQSWDSAAPPRWP